MFKPDTRIARLSLLYCFAFVLDATLADAGDISDTLSGSAAVSKDTKDELSDILGPNFNPETIPYINSKDVEDILFKVLLLRREIFVNFFRTDTIPHHGNIIHIHYTISGCIDG